MRQEKKERCCNENGKDKATPDKGVVFFWCKRALMSLNQQHYQESMRYLATAYFRENDPKFICAIKFCMV